MSKLFGRIKLKLTRMSLRTRILVITSSVVVLAVFSSTNILIHYSNQFIYSLSNTFIKSNIEQAASTINSELFDGMHEMTTMLMKDKEVYDMLTKSHKKDASYQIDKVLFGEKIRKKYVASKDDKIKIVALLGKNEEMFSVSYLDDFDRDTVNEISRMNKICRKTTSVQWFPLRNDNYHRSINDNVRIRNSIWAYRSLKDPQTGEYIGMGIFTVSEQKIYEMYKNGKFSELSKTVLFSKDGKVISTSDFMDDPVYQFDPDETDFMLHSEEGGRVISKNGEKFLLITRPLKIPKWYICGKIPINQVYQQTSSVFAFGIIISIIFIILAFIFINALSNNIVKPVKTIINAMKRTEQGDFNTQVNIKGQYEISEVGQYFNNMVNTIRNMILVEYELERKKKQAEMNVLMSQINPHFLYNTLESIVWKAQIANQPEIGEMAAALGDIYRISVNNGDLLVNVSDELKHVQAYVSIQKMRYGEKFNIEYIVQEEAVKNLYTIKMTLQPIVENAITHGIREDGTSLKICVEVKLQNNKLVFWVKDNGKGMDEHQLNCLKNTIKSEKILNEIELSSQPTKRRHIGLSNTNERLKLYFGEEYGVEVESVENEYTTVSVSMPIIKNRSDFSSLK